VPETIETDPTAAASPAESHRNAIKFTDSARPASIALGDAGSGISPDGSDYPAFSVADEGIVFARTSSVVLFLRLVRRINPRPPFGGTARLTISKPHRRETGGTITVEAHRSGQHLHRNHLAGIPWRRSHA